MIITISRQYAAGGGAIARQVAEALGWTLVDNELVERVAERAGLSPEEVAAREERVPGFVERLAATLARSAPELVAPTEPELEIPDEVRLVRITESVVADLAAAGRVVLVGRAAPAVLGQAAAALHLKVVAPLADRVRTAVDRLGVDPRHAEKTVREVDGNRARYHREYYERDWNEATHYHLVLNTGALGLDGAVEVVLDRARRLGWLGGPGAG